MVNNELSPTQNLNLFQSHPPQTTPTTTATPTDSPLAGRIHHQSESDGTIENIADKSFEKLSNLDSQSSEPLEKQVSSIKDSVLDVDKIQSNIVLHEKDDPLKHDLAITISYGSEASENDEDLFGESQEVANIGENIIQNEDVLVTQKEKLDEQNEQIKEKINTSKNKISQFDKNIRQSDEIIQQSQNTIDESTNDIGDLRKNIFDSVSKETLKAMKKETEKIIDFQKDSASQPVQKQEHNLSEEDIIALASKFKKTISAENFVKLKNSLHLLFDQAGEVIKRRAEKDGLSVNEGATQKYVKQEIKNLEKEASQSSTPLEFLSEDRVAAVGSRVAERLVENEEVRNADGSALTQTQINQFYANVRKDFIEFYRSQILPILSTIKENKPSKQESSSKVEDRPKPEEERPQLPKDPAKEDLEKVVKDGLKMAHFYGNGFAIQEEARKTERIEKEKSAKAQEIVKEDIRKSLRKAENLDSEIQAKQIKSEGSKKDEVSKVIDKEETGRGLDKEKTKVRKKGSDEIEEVSIDILDYNRKRKL